MATLNRKIVTVGETSAGKSCLVLRFVRNEFSEGQEPTIGASFLTSSVVCDDATIKMDIWDTAGQERYRSLAPLYYRGAHAGLIVYDITSVDSFQGAKSWATELKRKGEADCVLALVGSKVDLESDRQVDRDEAAEYARSQGLLFAEVSSKTGAGVQDIFVRLAKALPRNNNAADDSLVTMDADGPKKKKCC